MKEIEFEEGQYPDFSALGQALFEDEKDPRSVNYQRVLIRPKIRWGRIVLYSILPLLFCVGLGLVLSLCCLPPLWCVLIPLLLFLGYFALIAKRAAVCLVRIYQRYAPDAIRNKCRFEPSCSQYMILAIEKYGLFKGIAKGIGRIGRCNVHGGGFDEP